MAENNDSEEPRWKWHYQQIGRLYEAAQRNEEGISNALTDLKQTRATFQKQIEALPSQLANDVKQELGANIAGEAGKLIVQKFEDANANAVEAAAAYKRAAKFSIGGMVAIGSLAILCGTAAMVITASFIMPDAEKLHALRVEEAALRANIEEWRRMGGAAVLSQCGPERRRCVRTDESAEEPFGDRGQTYRIIYGY